MNSALLDGALRCAARNACTYFMQGVSITRLRKCLFSAVSSAVTTSALPSKVHVHVRVMSDEIEMQLAIHFLDFS